MPSLKFLCLHGAGTSVEILHHQLGPLMRELQRDNTATFHFIEGEVESPPGPGIEGLYEGPHFSFYKWPRTIQDNDQSLNEAYEHLSETIREDGPFDGILGFSHGGTLAAGYLAHNAKNHPYISAPFRCAVFISSLPPFRLDEGDRPVFEDGLQGCINIPTVHVVGTNDFAYSHSVKLYNLCDPRSASLVVHDRGHEIPKDRKLLGMMTKALRDLNAKVSFLS